MAALAFVQKNKMLLSDCAELSLGYSFRDRIEGTPNGPLRIIQMRDLTDDQQVDAEHAITLAGHGFAEAHFLRPGDLVFRA